MSATQLALTLLITPLLSAALIGVFFRRQPAIAKAISLTAAVAIAALASLLIFRTEDFTAAAEWLTIGPLTLKLGFLLDPLSKLLLAVVALVGLLVHVFSLGYMSHEENQARFFGCLSLFMFSMTGLTLADDLIMLFIFWELVGLSSFLLINFYFEKPAAVAASKKAFIVNRIGDFGFLLGIILAYWAFGSITLADIAVKIGAEPTVIATSIGLLIFCGAVGKSGQLPLHVWLPDAMEGPTPVSALIHAATMVAAGIFLLCRVSVLMTGDALNVILWIGTSTALFAGFVALGQRDLKRILAYSTISQLGFMVAAFALGSLVALKAGANVSLAGLTGGVAAAMFHLTTHAFFKALLFLGSGSILHGTHHEGDIYRLGGLAKKMPFTFAFFTIGTLALIGCPFLAGFYSKDAILILAYQYSQPVFFCLLLGAFLTAFYMTRLWTTTFLGKARSEGADHAHESGPLILIPLAVLALGSLLGGYAWFYPEALRVVPEVALHLLHGEGHSAAMMGGTAAFVVGSALGFLLYRPGSATDFLQTRLPVVYQVLEKRLYIDAAYDWYVAKVQQRFALVLNYIDRIGIAGIGVRGFFGGGSGALSLAARALHTGSIHTYVYWFLGGVVLLWAIATGVL
jgi:NADH-quinone oxidoreductase subunit L